MVFSADEPSSPLERARRWTDPAPWAVLVGTLVAGARLAPDPTGRLLGHTLSEAPGHLWIQWLLDRAATGDDAWFGQQDIILGESLWVVPTDWLARLVTGLLGIVTGPVLAYNLTALGLLALVGAAVVRVARIAGAGRWSSAVAAPLAMGSPALLGFLADGRIDSVGVGWAALLAASWLLAMRAPTWGAGLRIGGWATLVILSGPNLVIATALAAVVPSVVAVLLDRRRLRPLAGAAAVAAVSGGVLLGLLVLVEQNDPGRLEQRSNEERRPAVLAVDAEAIAGNRFADTWAGAATLNREVPVGTAWAVPTEIQDNPLTRNAADMVTVQPYAPGAWWTFAVVPWLLALVGLLLRPRESAPWLALAAGLHVLGLGYGAAQTLPLSVGGQLWYVAPAVLLDRIPGLSIFNNYGLFSVFHGVALAVAAALGARALPGRPWALVAVVALWGVEVQRGPVPLPLAVSDIRLPDGLVPAIDAAAGERAVVVLPLGKDINNYLQIHHGRPTPMRFRFGPTSGDADPILADPNGSVNALVRTAAGGPAPPDLAGQLASGGVGAVVVLPGLLPPEAGARLEAAVAGALGAPSWTDGERRVYRMPAR